MEAILPRCKTIRLTLPLVFAVILQVPLAAAAPLIIHAGGSAYKFEVELATTPAEREHTTDLLKRAAKTRAVIVVEHDMEFVRRLDCKVTVLHEGSVLAEGTLDHVTSNQQVIDVYLGR